MTSRSVHQILRGDTWTINFDPTIGDEIQKLRPAVVLTERNTYRYRLQLVVPNTSWQEKFKTDFWMIYLQANIHNGLGRDSAANAFQIRSLSEQRFVKKLGVVPNNHLDSITAAVALCIGYRTQAMPALVAALCLTPHRAA